MISCAATAVDAVGFDDLHGDMHGEVLGVSVRAVPQLWTHALEGMSGPALQRAPESSEFASFNAGPDHPGNSDPGTTDHPGNSEFGAACDRPVKRAITAHNSRFC